MALFRKFFYRKPPDGLLEISERVYVFDCCFSTDVLEEDDYKVYMGGIVVQLRDHFPDASFMVFNFREGERQSQVANILSEYDMTVMDYPRQYEGCPLLTMEMIHHFLRSSESWLSLGQQNLLLMHCERGGWPVLAFMLAGLLIYRKQYIGEQKTLDMIYKQAPRELLQLLSPLNPMPSQLRYLHYVSRRNVGSEWPPLARALTLDCVILRILPTFVEEGGCRPIFRIYGQDPLLASDKATKVLYSMPKKSKLVRLYKQAECELVKIDIHCHIQGDVVLECITLDEDLDREEMMFRVMFNTAFIRSNILMLNRDEIDILWDAKDRFPKDFRAEVLFSEMDTSASQISLELPHIEEKEGLPIEAFSRVQEIFNNADWLDPMTDAALNVLQEKLEAVVQQNAQSSNQLEDESLDKLQVKPKPYLENNMQSITPVLQDERSKSPPKSSLEPELANKNIQPKLQVALQRSTHSKIITHQSAISSPISYGNSPLGSPMSLSRYHSAPSALGITALLHDHASYASTEANRQVKASSPSLSPSASVISCLPSFVSPISTSVSPPIPPPPPLPPSSCTQPPSTLQPSLATSTTRSSAAPPPPPPPPPPVLSASKHASIMASSVPAPLRHPSPVSDHPIKESPPVPPPAPPTLAPPQAPLGPASSPPPPPPPPPLPGAVLSPPPPPMPGSVPSRATSAPRPPTPPPVPSTTSSRTPPPPPPPPPSHSRPPPPPPPPVPATAPSPPPPPPFMKKMTNIVGPPPPPPPPLSSEPSRNPTAAASTSMLPPPSPASLPPKHTTGPSRKSSVAPPVPPPPAPFGKGTSRAAGSSALSSPGPPSPAPPVGGQFGAKGNNLVRTTSPKNQQSSQSKRPLKPLHWLKLTRAMQGSLWAEAQKSDEASKAPEFDMSELENLFSTAVPNSDKGRSSEKSHRRASLGGKSDKVQLIDLRRAYNCEIMLTKVKVPLPDLMSSVLALDDSALDVDQVDNLIKFCPTKEEMELLKGYNGDKENLGKCELFFLELMKVPRVESKLRVFSFKIQFPSQVSDLRNNLNIINSAAEEIRNSGKLTRIMQTILNLGNALNQGTARGSAIGFRLDSLLKLTDTRALNNRMTLMHYLCKVLADQMPELLDFNKDLVSLEAASKIQLKYLAEEMQAISKGLEKVEQELIAAENDGPVSQTFRKRLKKFLVGAEAEVRSLASLYSGVGRSADALALYFGEDPARCPFEQVISTLLNFVRMFCRSHDENCKQLELEKKKAQKEAEFEKAKMTKEQKGSEQPLWTQIMSGGRK